jgi:hypothetical protein
MANEAGKINDIHIKQENILLSDSYQGRVTLKGFPPSQARLSKFKVEPTSFYPSE